MVYRLVSSEVPIEDFCGRPSDRILLGSGGRVLFIGIDTDDIVGEFEGFEDISIALDKESATTKYKTRTCNFIGIF